MLPLLIGSLASSSLLKMRISDEFSTKIFIIDPINNIRIFLVSTIRSGDQGVGIAV